MIGTPEVSPRTINNPLLNLINCLVWKAGSSVMTKHNIPEKLIRNTVNLKKAMSQYRK